MAGIEVAGRPPLPRHKGLPAAKKGDREMGREESGDSLWKRRQRRCRKGWLSERDDTNMTFDYMGRLEWS